MLHSWWSHKFTRKIQVQDRACWYLLIDSFLFFRTLTRNIRTRRGQKVEISLPLFKDTKTDSHISSKLPCLFPDEEVSTLFLEPNRVYMDCMAFGMGCCCLQVTFQAADMSQARFIYDQFAILSPIMVPITNGIHYSNTDYILVGSDGCISSFQGNSSWHWL